MDSWSGSSIASATPRRARALVLVATGCASGFLVLCEWFPPAWFALGLWLLTLLVIARITSTAPGLARWLVFVAALYSCWGSWRFWTLPPEADLLLFFPHHRWQKLLNLGESACLVGAAGLMMVPSVASWMRGRHHAPTESHRLFSGSILVALGACAWTIALALPWPWIESGSRTVFLPLLPALLGLRFLLARRLHFLDAGMATMASLLAGLISLVVTFLPMGYMPLIVPLSRTTRGQVVMAAGAWGTYLLGAGTLRVWRELRFDPGSQGMLATRGGRGSKFDP